MGSAEACAADLQPDEKHAIPGAGRVLRVLSITAVFAGAAAVSWWSHWLDATATGVVILLVISSFAATAAVLAEDPEQRPSARAIALSAACYLVSWGWGWPPEWQASPLPLISFVCGYLWVVCLGAALIRYPHARLERWYERLLLVAFAGWVCGGKLVIAAVSRPGWADFDDRAWWLALAPDQRLFTTLTTIFNIGLVAFGVGLVALLLGRIWRGRGLERVDALPAVVAAVTIAVSAILYIGTRILGLPGAVIDVLRIATAAAALLTPIAFLAVEVRRQLIRSAAAEFLPRIYYATTLDEVRAELRRALRDPDLELWLPGEVPPPDAIGDRYLVPVSSTDGALLAIIGMPQAVRRHSRLVDAATGAVGMLLDRQANQAEIAASQARLQLAERLARHDIARDLHDGAQQVLLSAQLRLAVATRRAADDASTKEAIEQARTEVVNALEVIRGLAAGAPVPAGGKSLAEALPELVRSIDIPVHLHVAAERLPAAIERNLWFIASEAITNMRKHSGATSASLTIERHGDTVELRVIDDGRGGAECTGHSGLAGAADRARALGGRMEVRSPVGQGTTVLVRLPCA
jgi:signal transduction histidine kinase